MAGRFAIVCCLALATTGCSYRSDSSDEADEIPGALVEGNSEFAFDLYAKLRNDRSGNLFFSPHSISAALAMTYAGAAADTERQMADVLHFTLPQDELHTAFASLTNQFAGNANDDEFELRIANRLWGQTGHDFRAEFLQVTRDDYGAELAQLDFISQANSARETINDWVEDQTAGKIQDLIGPDHLNQFTRLVLTNAIYFNGRWTHEFDKALTRNANFHVSATEEVRVPMMHQEGEFRQASTDDVEMLEMTYRGGRLSMLVLLPAKKDGLPVLESNLTNTLVGELIDGLRAQRVRVSLPRFTATSQFELAEVLKSMGMHDALDRQLADFSGMDGTQDLFVSAVVHKAYVDVDEQGTEAAAASGTVTTEKSEMTSFVANHPFIFLIRDDRTGSILFFGRIMNPTSGD